MSLSLSKIVNLPPAVLNFLTPEPIDDESIKEYPTLGGILSNTDYAWLANGPNLEIINTYNGIKIGAWSFNLINNAEIICVEEMQKINKRPSLLAVVLDCGDHGSMICVFDFVTSKVIRAIEVQQTITSLLVVDSGNDIFTLPSPLRAFDGILAIGTAGGPVYLIDIGRQICDEGLTLNGLADVRDELNSCKLSTITLKDIDKIELHKESAVRHNDHLAIYLNATFDNKTQHFLLKGPKGEHRTYVDAKEAAVSALFYCSQLGSLLIGYNFGAFQVYNLVDLSLIYTSPICEEHLPITHFTIQEPADDPRAYCYIWAVYSAGRDFQASFPLAVMYAFCYHTKEYHEGYGFLYQNFNYASIQFQMDLNSCSEGNRRGKPQGGRCLRLNTIQRGHFLRDTPHNDSTDDNLSLSIFVWNVVYNKRDTDTCVCIFDLNQWYKEQLPNIPDTNFSSTYMIQFCVSNLFNSSVNQDSSTLDVNFIEKSLKQFKGVQKLEEYLCPNSLSYDLCALREDCVIFLQSKGVQKSLLAHIESSGPLCLIEPPAIYQQVIGLGLLPLFVDLPSNVPISTNQQREIILSTALEHHLRGWLCKCTSEWASGNFLSSGCSLDFLISWAFQRATTLKTNCDNFCIPLFDYSQTKLDANTAILFNNCIRQLRNLTNFYVFIIEKLSRFLSNPELVEEQCKSLESIVVYFEVLQWLLNIGLLPECPISSYPQVDDFQRMNVPYPAEILIDFYNQRRGVLKIENGKQFSSSNSPLFIDNLIDNEYGGEILQGHWRKDGGNGMYPPPSIQALLRTYLVEDADILFKHTIVSYVFLDLVMILEEDRYKAVVAYLIKFPTVFKLSLSKIKIIQAFWQLDHGDCNTAMGLLLDPLVVKGDLNEWHHKIVLRLLILQDQQKLALLYLQVRKPIIKDNEDICAIISLYVANDMLDEAFYFEHCYGEQSNNRFLLHLFDEAEKNGKLKSIIHRSLSQEQETLFLAYLARSQKPYAQNLQIYYHILRSRYIEAFNLYNNSLSNQVECQGLVGQLHANPRDQLIHNLKKLFPEINQNILNFCHQNKDYVFQNVPRPTPMSVFVHNSEENVHYKSNLIGAAMAKARQTFNESFIDRKFLTETTPFIRTSTMNKTTNRETSIVIDSKVIKIDNTIDSIYESPPPNKRLKLSPKSNKSTSSLSTSKLDTPIVKRKIPKTSESMVKINVPQSILKKLSTKRDDHQENVGKFNSTPISSLNERKSIITPRKSLERASPSVRFEGVKSLSPDHKDKDLSIETNNSEMICETPKSPTIAASYSSDVSFNDSDVEVNSSQHQDMEKLEDKISPIVFSPKSRKSLSSRSSARLSSKKSLNFNNTFDISLESSKDSSKILLSTSSLEIESNPTSTTKSVNTENSRKNSSKKCLDFDDSLNSSTESVNKTDVSKESMEFLSPTKSSLKYTKKDESPKDPPNILPNLRPRKSLCRQVLENNTASRVLASPKRRLSKRLEKEECSQSTETIQETRIESSLKFNDGQQVQKTNLIEKHSISSKTLIEETDEDDISFNINDTNETIGLQLSESIKEALNESSKIYSSDMSQEFTNKNFTLESLSETKETSENIPTTDQIVVETANQNAAIDQPTETILNTTETNEKPSESILKDNETIQESENTPEPDPKSEIINIDELKTYNDDDDDDDDNVMEVDDYDINNETDGKSSNNDVNDDDVRLIYDDLSQSSQTNENNDLLKQTLNNEINIYEITDDNDGIEVEEVILEEDNDFQSSLMQENELNQTPSALERNIIDNDSSDDDDDDDNQQSDKPIPKNKQLTEPEIIEIMSSSEEEDKHNTEDDSDDVSSSSDNSSFDNNIVYERNIDNSSSETSESTDKSEINSDNHDVDEEEYIDSDGSYGKGGESACLDTETIKQEEEAPEDDIKHQDLFEEIDKNEEIDYKKRQSYGLFHGPIVELDKTVISQEDKIVKDVTTEKLQVQDDTTVCAEEKTEQDASMSTTENQKLEENQSKINETHLTVEERDCSQNESQGTIVELHETAYDEEENNREDESTKVNINDTVNQSMDDIDIQQLGNSETNANETHSTEEKLESFKIDEIDYKKRQSYGFFHGPIVETTIHEEDEPEKNNDNKLVDENESRQLVNPEKEQENSMIIDENEDISRNEIVKEEDHEIDYKKRQSYGLFHGNIIETTNRDEDEPEKESSITFDNSKIENQSIDDNNEIDYKKRQSYGLFHGSIIETNETTIDEDKDCLTKLDISVIENRAVDEIKHQIIAEIGGCQQLNESTGNDETKSNIIETDMIELRSTVQKEFENSEMIDIPSISEIEHVGKRKMRRRATSEDVDVTLRRSTRRRSASFHSEGHQDSINSDSENTSILSKSLRSRIIKLDEGGNQLIQRQHKANVDDPTNSETIKQQKKPVKRRTSISQLPEIIEEEDEENRTKRVKETLANYSMSRRITRRQATLLQRIDPVVVLDKLPTDENLKLAEATEHERSLTDSTSSQVKPKRRLRTNSQNSNTSVQSDSKVSSTTGTKMRLRSSSMDQPSDSSEKSVASSKRNKKTKSESGDNSPETEIVTRTRSRTNSESSTASNVSITSRTTRNKANSSKLPEIQEEDVEVKPIPSKRVTRKRSTQK